MKIAFFTNSYRPLMYGSATSVESFRSALERLGHQVFVFAPKFHGYRQQNTRVIEYPSLMYGYKIKYPLPFRWYPPASWKARKLNLDIIHSHHPFSIGQDGLRIAKKLSIPLVFTHHARYADYTHYVLPIMPQKMIKKIIKGKVRRYANKCDRVIAPSPSIKSYIERMGIEAEIDVVSTGIDWKSFQSANGERVRQEHGLGDQKVILNLGRLDKEKNLGFLTDAVFRVLRERKDSVFLLVGDGSLVKMIKTKAQSAGLSDRVIFAGLVDQAVVRDYYAASDVFVCASQTETQGMTITEAKASGLPIVALEGTGISDQIDPGRTGLLAKGGLDEFEQLLKKLLDNESMREMLGNNAKDSAKEMDIIAQAKKLSAIYQTLLSKKANVG